ncbi:MAG TPA: hypothetical protein VF229_08120 [Burkholderiaceae bacterium]
MPLTVRLPRRVEQELAAYCVRHGVTRSRAVREALETLLAEQAGRPSPFEIGRAGFGSDDSAGPTVARDTKRLLHERFRGSGPR